MIKFNHCNLTITDRERSCEFYKEQFGLTVVRHDVLYEGTLHLTFLSDGVSDFLLELTWYKDHKEVYDLGDNEFHVSFCTNEYDKMLEKHKKAGILVSEKPAYRLYFVKDPDGYQIEVIEEANIENAH